MPFPCLGYMSNPFGCGNGGSSSGIRIGLDDINQRSNRGNPKQQLSAHKNIPSINDCCVRCLELGNHCGEPFNENVVAWWMDRDIPGPQGVVYNGTSLESLAAAHSTGECSLPQPPSCVLLAC